MLKVFLLEDWVTLCCVCNLGLANFNTNLYNSQVKSSQVKSSQVGVFSLISHPLATADIL